MRGDALAIQVKPLKWRLLLLGAGLCLAALGVPGDTLSRTGVQGESRLLSDSPAWIFEPDRTSAQLGKVFGAGDINGDGFDDVVAGAGGFSGTLGSQGRAWAFLGQPGPPYLTQQWSFDGQRAGEGFGEVGADAGDVNGDGFADVIFGSPFHDQRLRGRASLFYGSAAGLQAAPGWSVDGERDFSNFGSSVASAGDVNGDGFDDVIVSAPLYDTPQLRAGRLYVFLGSAAGLSSTAAWIVDGKQKEARLGSAVAPAGDVNGDGFDDVIVGALMASHANESYVGRAMVFLGSPAGLARNPVWSRFGDQAGFPGAEFGSSVAPAGDVNGDGLDDIVVGAYLYDNGQQDEGRAYLFYGTPSGVSNDPAWIAESDIPNARFGAPTRGNLDINGDGYSDIIVGAPEASQNSGAVWVYLGSPLGPSATPDQILISPQTGSLFGGCNPAGDVDGDGFDDVVVGASHYSGGQTYEGAAFLYRGSNQ